MWTHTILGKWPRVRQRETTVRIHAEADATTTTTTHFRINTRCANTAMMSDMFRLTGQKTNVTVAVGEEVTEGRLPGQTPGASRLPKGAHLLLLLHVEALHLVG